MRKTPCARRLAWQDAACDPSWRVPLTCRKRGCYGNHSRGSLKAGGRNHVELRRNGDTQDAIRPRAHRARGRGPGGARAGAHAWPSVPFAFSVPWPAPCAWPTAAAHAAPCRVPNAARAQRQSRRRPALRLCCSRSTEQYRRDHHQEVSEAAVYRRRRSRCSVYASGTARTSRSSLSYWPSGADPCGKKRHWKTAWSAPPVVTRLIRG